MRFRLLQAREPGDIVREEERAAFADRLGVPVADVLPHDLLAGPVPLSAVLDGVDAVLVGGSGAHSVFDDAPWIRSFIDLVGEVASSPTPMFASCFGFQALVVAMGGRVARDESRAEVGTFEVIQLTDDDPLFQHLPRSFAAQLGHKDHAVVWPASLTLLAASERCPYQAARVPGTLTWATQFHPELTGATNRQRFERYRSSYEHVFGVEGYRHMLNGFQPSPEHDGLLAQWRALLPA
jgi:GMP synthase (glutamine-hydrolysing)